MKCQAFIVAVREDWIDCRIINESKACCRSGDCDSASCHEKKHRSVKASVPEGVDLKAGDRVELSFPGSMAIWGFVRVFILPVLLGAAFWLFLDLIPAVQQDSARVPLVFVFVLLILLGNALFRKNRPQATVTNIRPGHAEPDKNQKL